MQNEENNVEDSSLYNQNGIPLDAYSKMEFIWVTAQKILDSLKVGEAIPFTELSKKTAENANKMKRIPAKASKDFVPAPDSLTVYQLLRPFIEAHTSSKNPRFVFKTQGIGVKRVR